MSFAIRGLGTALPSSRLSQAESAAAATFICAEDEEQAQMLTSLYRHTEIESRHVVFRAREVGAVVSGTGASESVFIPHNKKDRGPTTAQRMERYETEALPLVMEASRSALNEADIRPREITHLVTVSCTGFAAPGVDIGLMKTLGLKPTTQRTNVGFMGCHGALNGLRVAAAITGSDPKARVLLCAVELCSLHYYYGWNPKKMVGNALFADGAAAIVGVPADQADSGEWQVAANGSCLFNDSEYAMAWHIGDYGFDMMLSTRVPALIAENLRPWLEEWLGRHGLTVATVGSWAVHPGGPRILNSVEEALNLPKGTTDVSREVLSRCGNMSSPTVLFILEQLRRRNAPRPCVALGFGPGLVAEGAILQ